MRYRTARWIGRLLGLVAILFIANPPVCAQAPTNEFQAVPACRTCRIELTTPLTLRAPDTSTFASSPNLYRDHQGRYLAEMVPLSIGVFDSIGRFVRLVGRRGQGPGEFVRNITSFHRGPGDSLLVFHDVNQLSVYSPDLTFVRRRVVPALSALPVVAPDGRMVLVGRNLTPERSGYPLNTVHLRDTVVRSFGNIGPAEARPSCEACLTRWMSLALDHRSLWASVPNRYEIQRWSLDGELISRFVGTNSPWMVPWNTDNMPGHEGSLPPRTILGSSFEDGKGLLWVLATGPASDWKPDPSFDQPTMPGVFVLPRRGLGDYLKGIRASIIEVIDLSTRSLLASRRFDRQDISFLSADLVWSPREEVDGDVVIDIRRVQLVR